MNTSTVAFRCVLSNSHALAQGEQMLYLLVEVGAPDVPLSRRSPLNLCLTLDQSGSMHGEKLNEAKEAAKEVTGLLEDADYCSLVAFHGRPSVMSGARPMDGRGKRGLQGAIDGLSATDGTDILAALRLAHAELKKRRVQEAVNGLLLLSDGQDSSSTDDLRREAEACLKDGIGISTVGLGDDHDEDKMSAIALAAGGQFLYAQQPSEVGPFFQDQTRRMLELAVRKLSVRLVPSRHVSIQRLLNDNYQPSQRRPSRPERGDEWMVPLYDMSRGDTQSLIFEIHCAHPMEGEFRIAQAELTYELTEGGPGTANQDIILIYTSDMTAIRAGRNVEVLRRREELNVANVLVDTMTKLKRGQLSAAQAAQQLDSANAQLLRHGQSDVTDELTRTIRKVSQGDTSSQTVKISTQIATRIKQVGK